jgi:hypothetical protein
MDPFSDFSHEVLATLEVGRVELSMAVSVLRLSKVLGEYTCGVRLRKGCYFFYEMHV